MNKVGNAITKFGGGVQKHTPSSIGKNMRTSGYRNVGDAISTMSPTRNMYRHRYNGRRI